ncbi:MAG: hypothetical protein IR158_03215 [Cellulomonas sp.]|uniref:hypothetical protein n=1 Tax=Cellulomonas sp. TaxID=40001 RepID=UPI0019FD1D92|nr:hypothetical protein [Cellulomonas sp.]MBF0686764.1 hypothetical protein [Cellulomonas sp.]
MLPRRPPAPLAVIGLVVVLSLSACAAQAGGAARVADDRDTGARDTDARGSRTGEEVDCALMLDFLATTTELPGNALCRRTTGIDTLYEAQTTAAFDAVDAWLADVRPGAVLGDTCAGVVDRCVQVFRDPEAPGAWHVLDVDVTGTGPDAAVHVAAFDT